MISLLAAPRVARAESTEDKVVDIAADAMANDYPRQRYTAARKKLEGALKKCGKKACSDEVRAEVERDLGVVYLALGKKRQAERAFKKAVELEPDGRLDPEFATPRVNEVFAAAGGQLGEPEPEPEPEAEGDAESEATDDADTDSESSETPERADADDRTRNWFSLSVQQDLLFHPETQSACGGEDYVCFSGGSPYTGPIWPNYGNRVNGGLALATTRVLFGYERVFGEHLAVGARLGFAFGGGPTAPNREKFMPFHAELRLAVYFGKAPFAGSAVRPYLALGGGLAEVQSRLSVDYYEDAAAYNQGRQGTLDAWRTSGRGFVAPTVGTHFPLGRTTALTLELRVLAMLGRQGVAPAAGIGFTQGL